MTAHPFDWVDAFAEAPFGGNPCMVVHDADPVPEAARTALVRETSLSECAYVVASDRADFGARYYLADREIGFAGHPTVATVVSLVERGRVPLSAGRAELTLEVGAGVLPIEVALEKGRPRVTMTQPAPEFGATHAPAEIADLYHLSPDDILGMPQTVSTGTPFCIAVLASQDALRRARLDTAALGASRRRAGHPLADMMEPFLVTLEGATEAGDTFSRLLLAPPLPAEDSFTGSATGCMAAYLWARDLIESPRFTAEQGHWMGRPGRAEVEVLGPRDAIGGVRVSGAGAVLMRGMVDL